MCYIVLSVTLLDMPMPDSELVSWLKQHRADDYTVNKVRISYITICTNHTAEIPMFS